MYSAALENVVDGDLRDTFPRQLHQFVGVCQALVLALTDRKGPISEISSRIVSALPVPESAGDFFLLRSVVLEFVIRALQTSWRESDELLHLACLPPSGDLAATLARCLGQLRPALTSPTTWGDGRAERAMALIVARCREPALRSATVARSVGISEACLARLLRTHYGCSFSAARRRARVEIARAQLEASWDSVKEIAARAGYSSTSQLDRDFRLEYGLPPGLFRRRLSMSATVQVP